MSGIKSLAAWAVLSLSIAAPAVQAGTASLSHYEPLQRLDIRGSGAGGDLKIAVPGPVDLSFDALGRNFLLQLAPNNSLLEVARNVAGATVVPYRGRLAGNDDSWVRIVMADGVPSGLIWDGSELYSIERPGENIAGSDTTIIYRLADLFIQPGSITCGAGGSMASGSVMYEKLVSELHAAAAQAPGAVSYIDIGIVADAEFYGLHGDNSGQAIIDRMSRVDGYFSEQVGVQINWPLVQIFKDSSSSGYPFTATVSVDPDVPDNLLTQLGDYRNSNPNQYANGLTHLWTGKNVQGSDSNNSTVGIAYTGALCLQRTGVALSEGRRDPTLDSLIAAHEIGHNFGAPHDGEALSACESVDVTAGDYLMEASLTKSTEFSQCSLEQMADDIEQAEARGCITRLPNIDIGIAVEDRNREELLGNSATISFDLANSGTLPAAAVAAEFTLPDNVSLVSATTSMGNCSDGGGIVDCAIGEVAGLSSLTVVLTADTTGVGRGNFTASVTTIDDDNDLSNNRDSVTLTVLPAVNLSVTPPSPQRIDVDASTGLTALLENTSVLDATGVTLGITLSSGLRVDSASWPLGACSVSAGRIDCEGATFAAQSNVILSLGVTGTTEGTKTVDFTLSSAETEADPADNSGTATVNVGAQPQEASGGGGGGAVLWLLPLLGTIALRRRKLAQGLLTPSRLRPARDHFPSIQAEQAPCRAATQATGNATGRRMAQPFGQRQFGQCRQGLDEALAVVHRRQAEIGRESLPDVRTGPAPAEGAGRKFITESQHRDVFPRVVRALPRRVAAVIRRDDQQVIGLHRIE